MNSVKKFAYGVFTYMKYLINVHVHVLESFVFSLLRNKLFNELRSDR